jgi:hypothetical protein
VNRISEIVVYSAIDTQHRTYIQFNRGAKSGKHLCLKTLSGYRLSALMDRMVKAGTLKATGVNLWKHKVTYEPVETPTSFVPTRVSIEDIKRQGWDVSRMTAQDFQRFADKMGSAWTEYGGYWDSLDSVALWDFDLPRLFEPDDQDDDFESIDY